LQNQEHTHKKWGRFSDFYIKFGRENTKIYQILQVLDKFVGEKNHLAREITRNKCGNCEEKSGELPATCKEKVAKIFQSIEK
jgi:hypothetical protein